MDTVEGLKEKTADFTENIDRKLEKLIDFERTRNDKLMVAYAKLKAKYDNLLKTRETNLSKLERMVKVKFVKDELEKWLQHIRKNAK